MIDPSAWRRLAVEICATATPVAGHRIGLALQGVASEGGAIAQGRVQLGRRHARPRRPRRSRVAQRTPQCLHVRALVRRGASRPAPGRSRRAPTRASYAETSRCSSASSSSSSSASERAAIRALPSRRGPRRRAGPGALAPRRGARPRRRAISAAALRRPRSGSSASASRYARTWRCSRSSAKRSASRPSRKLREGAGVLLGAAAGRWVAAEVPDQPLETGHVPALLLRDRAGVPQRVAVQHLLAGRVRGDYRVLQREQRSEQRRAGSGLRRHRRAGDRRRRRRRRGRAPRRRHRTPRDA